MEGTGQANANAGVADPGKESCAMAGGAGAWMGAQHMQDARKGPCSMEEGLWAAPLSRRQPEPLEVSAVVEKHQSGGMAHAGRVQDGG